MLLPAARAEEGAEATAAAAQLRQLPRRLAHPLEHRRARLAVAAVPPAQRQAALGSVRAHEALERVAHDAERHRPLAAGARECRADRRRGGERATQRAARRDARGAQVAVGRGAAPHGGDPRRPSARAGAPASIRVAPRNLPCNLAVDAAAAAAAAAAAMVAQQRRVGAVDEAAGAAEQSRQQGGDDGRARRLPNREVERGARGGRRTQRPEGGGGGRREHDLGGAHAPPPCRRWRMEEERAWPSRELGIEVDDGGWRARRQRHLLCGDLALWPTAKGGGVGRG